MNAPLVKVGTAIINLDAIAATHWDNGKLFVYLIGGRFVQVYGEPAKRLSDLLVSEAVDVQDCEINCRS